MLEKMMVSARLRKIQERERKSESPIEEMVRQCLDRAGVQYRQQEPIGPFFADFYLPEVGVVLECDGKEFHDGVRDGKRDAYMRERGYRIFRLQGTEINHSPMRTVLRVLGDITGNSEWSDIIPRLEYGRGKFCEGNDPRCPECRMIRNMDKGVDYEGSFDQPDFND